MAGPCSVTSLAPDERHRIPLACRCLLIRDDNRTILLETGIGAFFAPPLRDRFGVVEDRHVLLESLATLGVNAVDVDVIVLCSEGYTSSLAAASLIDLGLHRATDVVGGYHALKAEGVLV